MMIAEAIIKINANASFIVRGDDIDTCTIEWYNGTAEISKDDIKAKFSEVILDNLRRERTTKLEETDWMANSDVTMSSDMTTYRQALRDLPSNYTTNDSGDLKEDLSNLNWPTKP
tara:strand:- start:304 stop:648 length:345 start_codon:yes stop_codon:yes gene_type:complete